MGYEKEECYSLGILKSVPLAFDRIKNDELGWMFWIHGQYVLASPYDFSGNLASAFALTIPFVEDFSYSDKTDRPDDISNKNWSLRSEAWNYIAVTNIKKLDFVSVSKASMLEFIDFLARKPRSL